MIKTDQTLTTQDDYKLTETKPEPPKKDSEDYDIPKYMEQIELKKDQEERLLMEVKKEFEAIKKEREEKGLEEKWRALDNQYEGVMEEDELRQFNLSRKITKIKCDSVELKIMMAAWKTEQKFSVTARPEFERQGGQGVV